MGTPEAEDKNDQSGETEKGRNRKCGSRSRERNLIKGSCYSKNFFMHETQRSKQKNKTPGEGHQGKKEETHKK